MALIEATSVHKTYNSNGSSVEALNGITMRVDRGEFISLLGPSGSGKSTLLTILGGMTPPTSGQVVVDEIDIYTLSTEKLADFRHEYLGFIFQQLQLMPYLTALENVMLPLCITKLGNEQQRQLASHALDRVGLGGK
ncbi:MAG: ATP-binding cassette domain-containing protein, partial [Nitrospirota bacterium]|nr:ATP-binding cassette domain-containing protein [Nitrospirota bacterium]